MKLFYTSPAASWLEGLPLGNGRLGTVVYHRKEADAQVLALNEDTLWTGYPQEDEKVFSPEEIYESGQLTLQGKYREARDLLEKRTLTARDAQMYTTPGDLVLHFMASWHPENYTRSLDLETAVMTESYTLGGARVQAEAFVSAPAQCLVYTLCSEKPLSLAISGEDGWLTEKHYTEEGFTLRGQVPGCCGTTVGKTGEHEMLYVDSDPAKKGMRYVVGGRVFTEGGSVKAAEDCLMLLDVTRVVLVVSVRTSFNGYDRHPFLEGRDEMALLAEDFQRAGIGDSMPDTKAMKSAHSKDYAQYFSRVSLHLGESGREGMDLKERLRRYEADADDLSLTTLLFDYGRYLLISGSRPGTQATSLQGIWNHEKCPPWFSDYTVNINTEMNYWLAGPCHLTEMEEPLVRLMEELTVTGRRTAREMFDAPGTACFHNTDLWRKTTPANGRASWAFWPFASAWLCRNLYEHYLFTGDRSELERILPILRENVLFCMGRLQENDAMQAFVPGTSPENQFLLGEEPVATAAWTENTLAIVRNLLRDYIEGCEVLGVSDEVLQEARAHLSAFRKPVISPSGRIQEWNEDFPEPEVHHRHLSHLYSLHPGRDMASFGEDYVKAARESLVVRGDEASGWSMAWKILMWARLEKGERAWDLCQHLFHLVDPDASMSMQGGGVYPNLLCAHPPFQIDGNYGFTAGICEMLVQSHLDEIVLLPAIPATWRKGSVTGLLARGATEVSIAWENGHVKATLRQLNEPTRSVRVRIGRGETREVTLARGEDITIEA